jgi:hypothetical protein
VAGQIVMCSLASIGYFALAARALYVVAVYVFYRKHMHHSFHKAVLSVLILIDTLSMFAFSKSRIFLFIYF